MKLVVACLGSWTLASGKVYFSETFGADWESRWTRSKLEGQGKKRDGKQGQWAHVAGKWFKDENEDKGIATNEHKKYFGISASFPSFSNEDKQLVIQYQAKYEFDVQCGGGYIKIGPKMSDPSKFGNDTPYNIMFGPDQCGYTKRTHLIFNYNVKGLGDTNVDKRHDLVFKQEQEGVSHLYRLILKPDNTARVEIDGEKVYEGSLKEDWLMIQPKMMPDTQDKKPSDWVEEAEIDDPTDKMPDDWATEKRIDDPAQKKPDDWDDEEEGDWEHPQILNPEYKGEWHVKQIPNPAYIGVWEARLIDNPNFEDDDYLYMYPDFSYIGFDLWQVKGGTIFDNIIVCDDPAEADAFAADWKARSEVEKAAKKAEYMKNAEAANGSGKNEYEEEDDDEDKKQTEEI